MRPLSQYPLFQLSLKHATADLAAVAPAWVDLAAVVCAWAVSLARVLAPLVLVAPAWALLVPEDWVSLVRGDLSDPEELVGQAEASGQAGGQATDGLVTDGVAGVVDAGGLGGVWVLVPSRWLRRGRATAAATVTTLVSSGCPIMAG